MLKTRPFLSQVSWISGAESGKSVVVEVVWGGCREVTCRLGWRYRYLLLLLLSQLRAPARWPHGNQPVCKPKFGIRVQRLELTFTRDFFFFFQNNSDKIYWWIKTIICGEIAFKSPKFNNYIELTTFEILFVNICDLRSLINVNVNSLCLEGEIFIKPI